MRSWPDLPRSFPSEAIFSSLMDPSRTWLLAMIIASFLSPWNGLAQPSRSAANRLVYLDENDPFYVHDQFPKLTTPQWIGEPGVDAVVILAVDDMRATQ